ncbi:hypothetical protein OKA05_09065 [Luteolibacter arcticus]|uniref:Uncharacterized protein n=1 Tax=Luteolibacter arcticus TaxID=1581411 RepID=A0ABT3GGG2_9BACT|nr:hypothetical protein [Luteolibacter arcticus]MCW1922702.1 hypothetical protein [Luteolibacter arcticus]
MTYVPSRTPFRHPLAVDALANFTHPRCRVLGNVVRHPSGTVMAANGCVALRLARGPLTHDDTLPPACEAFLGRVDALPWVRFEPHPHRLVPHTWAKFDDVRANLYAYGLEELWHAGRLTHAKPVWTGEAIRIPLALLQLIARLPAVEARLDGATDYLLIRFSGGEGLVANRWKHSRAADIPADIFTLFKRPSPGMASGLIKPKG